MPCNLQFRTKVEKNESLRRLEGLIGRILTRFGSRKDWANLH